MYSVYQCLAPVISIGVWFEGHEEQAAGGQHHQLAGLGRGRGREEVVQVRLAGGGCIYYLLYLLYLLSTVSIIYSVSILSKVASPQLHAGPAPGLPDPGQEDEGELALGHPHLDT